MTNKKFFSFLGLLLLGLISLSSCSDSNDDSGSGTTPDQSGDASDQTKYEERAVGVNRGGTDDGTVVLRFYEDMPNVPYISAADFQALMLPGTSMKVEMTVAGEYTLTGPYASAKVSTTADTFSSDDYMNFTNLMGLVQPDMDNVYLDGAPFIRYNKMESTPATPTVTFDFKKYGLDIRGDGKAVYFPLITLSSMYSDLYYHVASYNGEKVLIITDNGNSSLSKFEPETTRKIINSDERPADVAEFGYKQLCFNVDHFYGMPGRSPLENGIKAKGLDKTLDELSTGALTKQLLKSTKMEEYFSGMTYLHTLLEDGGHTVLLIDLNALSAIDEQTGGQIWFEKIKERIAAYPTLTSAFQNSVIKIMNDESEVVSALRDQVLPSEGTYRTTENTAYCLFNTFGPTNMTAWNAYYKGGCQGDMPDIDYNFTGDLAVVLEALKTADADPEIKNFVVDLTCNHGGSLDVVLAMTQLMAGQSHFYCENVLTGQRHTIYYDVDANFDGKFDEKDKEVKFDLRYAVLTSHIAFSCGNLFPSLMKDARVPTFGERSGGGACAIQYFCTPEGLQYQLSSSRARLINNQWENIDSGITPTVPVEIGPDITMDMGVNGIITIPDYSKFWNIGSLIDNYYK